MQALHTSTESLAVVCCVCVCTQGARDAAGAVDDASEPLVVPEDIGRAAAQLLLEEVSRGGVTDGTHQGLLLLLAALGPEEMNEVSCGRATTAAVTPMGPCLDHCCMVVVCGWDLPRAAGGVLCCRRACLVRSCASMYF